MKKTGELLKQKRESAALSLSEVALATKINPKVLTAIENGDSANLPAKTFLKGFVRSYALFLKMDVDEVMRTFTDETGGPAPAPVHEAYQKPAESASNTPPRRTKSHEENSSTLRTVAVVVIVLLIGLIIGVRELIDKYQKEQVVASEVKVTPLTTPPVDPQPAPKTEDEETAEGDETKTSDAKTKVEVKSDDAKPAEASTNAKPAETKAADAKPVATKPEAKPVEVKPAEVKPLQVVAPIQGIPPGLAAPKALPAAPVKTEAKPENKTADVKPTETKPAEVKPLEAAAKPVASPVKVRNEVILEALDTVEVKFKVKGETKRLSLGPTQVHTIQADGPLTFDVSDGGAVNVIVNGKERGPAGPLGKSQQVTIP